MKKSSRYNLLHIVSLIIGFYTIVFGLNAQNNPDETIFGALKEEMMRNMTSLKLDKYAPPFHIANYLTDGKSFSVKASLGALIESKESPVRKPTYRIMVGNYNINDENFEGESRGYSSRGVSLSLPKANEPIAIRRVFWSMLDKSYKSTIDNYSQKLTALKQQNKDENEHLDDYTQVPPATLIMPSRPYIYDKKVWEKSAKEISAVFNNYPTIQYSSVDIDFINNNTYMVNNEGSKIKNNCRLACYMVNASTQAIDGEIIRNQLLYFTPEINQLPTLDSLKKAVVEMAKELEARCSAPIIEEAYQGPVIFEESALAELFDEKLFGEKGLVASREPVYAVDMNKSQRSSNNMENLIGRRLCVENITITAEDKCTTFGKTPLIGNFEIDAEGVTPPDRLTLVDKGILKTLLSDRTPTPKVRESNGHRRFALHGGYEKAPGVINISYANGQTYNDLLKTVTIETIKNGLEYFYIIRKFETSNPGEYIPSGNSGFPKPIALYKVSAKTGVQTLVRNALINEFPILMLKYALGGTSEQIAHNIINEDSMPVSYIIPRAMAFNDISIVRDLSPKSKLPIVKNPLEVKQTK